MVQIVYTGASNDQPPTFSYKRYNQQADDGKWESEKPNLWGDTRWISA
jgi:hypothetical protein